MGSKKSQLHVSVSSRRRGGHRDRYELKRAKPLFGLLMVGLIAIAVGIPVVAMVRWFGQATPQALATAPASTSSLGTAAATSVGLGVAASLVALLMALPVAVLATRYRGVAGTLSRARDIPLVCTSRFCGRGRDCLRNRSNRWRPRRGNVAVLVFAYAIMFTPIAVLALRVSFGQVDPKLDVAARSLGRGPIRSLVEVGFAAGPSWWPRPA